MNSQTKKDIFRRSSVTYYTASLFFPKKIKDDIFTLYAYMRIADDFVDSIPQRKKEFLAFKEETLAHLTGKSSSNAIIRDFVDLAKRKKFEENWIRAFLSAMEADLTKKTYYTFTELEKYMYGSAEVIGLFIASIMSLPKKSFHSAQLLGKSMQLLNFIRDVKEDISLGRTYLPEEDLKKFHIKHLSKRETNMSEFVLFELERLNKIQQAAEAGFHFIPRRLRLPIKTASDMYVWTAKQIKNNPLVIFDQKIKPKPSQVIFTYLKNFLSL